MVVVHKILHRPGAARRAKVAGAVLRIAAAGSDQVRMNGAMRRMQHSMHVSNVTYM